MAFWLGHAMQMVCLCIEPVMAACKVPELRLHLWPRVSHNVIITVLPAGAYWKE